MARLALWRLPGTVTSVGPEGKSEGLDQVTIGIPPGLGQQENLQLLGEGIGLELELESQEKEAGAFRADILCKDTASDDWVLIENQLVRTDHSHLGQLPTYAAGVEGATGVSAECRGFVIAWKNPDEKGTRKLHSQGQIRLT